MIVVQAAKGLDKNGKDEIIDKINNSESLDTDLDVPSDNQEPNDEDSLSKEDDLDFDENGKDDENMNESRVNIDEILNDVFTKNDKKTGKKIINNNSYRKKPFSNPNIK